MRNRVEAVLQDLRADPERFEEDVVSRFARQRPRVYDEM
jgi:hypothetical protein